MHIKMLISLLKSSYSNPFYLATSRMISSHSIASGSDYVKVNWTHLQFPPERYQLKYVCSVKTACTPSHDTSHYVVAKAQNISLDTTSVTISNLCPCSSCMLILLAVYNPASIDTGIMITGTTLDEKARSSGLHYFK